MSKCIKGAPDQKQSKESRGKKNKEVIGLPGQRKRGGATDRQILDNQAELVESVQGKYRSGDSFCSSATRHTE